MQALHKKSCKLSTKKITQPLQKNHKISLQKKSYNLQKKKSCNKLSMHKTSCNLSTHKLTQPLKKSRNLSNNNKNIARIAKHCPENITLIVKCVKLLFQKVKKPFFFLNFVIERLRDFFVERLHDFFQY